MSTTFGNLDLDERFIHRERLYLKVTTLGAVLQVDEVTEFSLSTRVERCENESPAERVLDALIDNLLLNDDLTFEGPRRSAALEHIKRALT